MTTMNVLDASGNLVAIEKPLVPGRAAAADSRPVAWSNEDLAVLSSIDTKLTTLAGYVDGLEALSTSLNGYVDGIEALIGTTNTSLSSIAGYVDGLEALNTLLNGYVDGLESLVTSTNTKLDTLHTDIATTLAGYVDGLEALETAISGKLPATLGQKAMSAALAVSIASDQSTFPVHPGASAAAGGIASTGRLLSAAGSAGDATNVKASAGRLYAIQGYNAAAAVRFLKLYNSSSAPTAGGGTPVKTLALPPGAAFAFDWPHGYSFSSGIGFTLVTGAADSNSASVTAADILGLNLDYV